MLARKYFAKLLNCTQSLLRSLRLILKETEDDGGGLIELIKVNPFVGGVSLGYVAGTEDDGGSSAHGDGRGVGEVIDTFGFAAFGGFQELQDDR